MGGFQIKKLNERGATLVEVAITVGLFLFLIIGGIDLSRLYFASHTLYHVLAEASRNTVILTATVQEEDTVTSDLRADIAVIANKFGLAVEDSDIVICPFDNLAPECNTATLPSGYFSVFVKKEIDVISPSLPFYARAKTMARFQSTVLPSAPVT
jgi:hypothetical protein